MTADELIRELRAARADLLSAMLGWESTDVWTDEGWTIHDLVGHIAAWDREVLATLQAWHEGGEPYTPEGWTTREQWNERARARRLSLYPEQVRMDFAMARLEIEGLLRGPLHEPETLAAPLPVAWGDTATPADLVRTHCIAHDREHAAMLVARRTAKGTP